MVDKAASSRTTGPEEDVKSLLARLYREIGISAVAAALEGTAYKPSPDGKPTDPALSTTLANANKKDLAA